MRRGVTPLLFLLIAAGCSTGPGKSFDPSGDYSGNMSGAVRANITLTVSGTTISGTGVVTPSTSMRGKDGTTHLTFSGTRTGIDIAGTLSAVTNLEYSIDDGTSWQDVTPPELVFSGQFTETGAVSGSWAGEFAFPSNPNAINGAWSALKGGAAGASLLRP
jgi:hypothetical protein